MQHNYRFSLTIEDELIARDFYDAWQVFRLRVMQGYYGPINTQIEDLGEVATESPEK